MMLKRRGLLIWSFDFDRYWVELASKIGLTTLGLHPIPGLPESDARSVEGFLRSIETEAFQSNVRRLEERGIEVELEVHAMHLLMPHAHFEKHPEWFRMDEVGVRTCDLNFCPSNEEALEEVEKRAQMLAERILPFNRSHRYFFWIDDCSQYCHCDACRELSPSDQALIIYNRILKGIRKVDPLATQSFLSYQATIPAPVKVSPDSGIFLEYAPIDRNSAFALEDASCQENVGQTVHIPGLLDCFGKEGSQVLEYWMDNSRFYQWKHPFGEMPFYPGTLGRDLAYYRKLGFENITSFACGLNEKYAARYGEESVAAYGRMLKG